MSKYKFKITYRNENEYGQYWGDNRYTVSIIAETLEQAKQKLDAISKNDYRMHKNILEWKADEIIEEKGKEIERLQSIIKEVREYIKAVGVLPRQIDSFVLLEILDKENI